MNHDEAKRKILDLAKELKENNFIWVSKMLAVIYVIMQIDSENEEGDFFLRMDLALEEHLNAIRIRKMNE